MRRNILVAIGCLISTVAFAQEGSRSALKKWKSCADAAAARYSKSAESAPVISRLAILSCHAEKQEALSALTQEDWARFAEDYVETAERRYSDLLAIDIIEMRLKR